MTPETLSVWIQRAGRAGRDGRLSRAILLVEPSVAKKLTVKSQKPANGSRNVMKGNINFASTMNIIVQCYVDRQQAPEPDSDGPGNCTISDPGKSDDEDDLQNVPMNNWEEFDEDAVYQKKHVDPEMRQWILTKDCRQLISDKYFNNPTHDKGKCN